MAYMDTNAPRMLHCSAPDSRIGSGATRYVPVKRLLQVLFIIFCAKIMLYLDLGGAAYGARYAALQEGTQFERVVSHALWIDPVSQVVIETIQQRLW